MLGNEISARREATPIGDAVERDLPRLTSPEPERPEWPWGVYVALLLIAALGVSFVFVWGAR